jgi:hypothetical protein
MRGNDGDESKKGERAITGRSRSPVAGSPLPLFMDHCKKTYLSPGSSELII